jgi:predicted alpha/beta-fold hydrolase
MENPPVLMIAHTMAGGTREPCSNNLADAARRRGFLAFVWNSRGLSGVKFTSRRFYNATKIDDIQAVISYVREKYKPSFFFFHGFSLGSYAAIRYAALDGGVDAVSGCSHTYNGTIANQCLYKPIQRWLYLPTMMQKLINVVKKNPFLDPKTIAAVSRTKTIDQWDKEFTTAEENVSDLVEYWKEASVHNNIPGLKTRALLLGADNDPFTEVFLQPRKEAENSPWLAFVHYPEGGHVSFPQGSSSSLIESIFLEYFAAVMNAKQ